MRTREIRDTGVTLTELGFGGGGLGELFVKVADAQADETLQASWDAGVRFFDSAPFYGAGLSEHRIGRFLRERPRGDFVSSTKVGRVLRAPRDPAAWEGGGIWIGGLPFDHDWDFSYDGVMRSHEDSLQRMGLNRVDMLVIHDLDSHHHDPLTLERHWGTLEASGWRALEELRAGGAVGALGAGINVVGAQGDVEADVARYLERFDLDFFIIAGRYTLLDQTALEDIELCRARGVDIVVGAVFNSGLLAHGAVEGATFNYQPAPSQLLERTARLAAVCERHDVALRAAAMQFPLAHPTVRSVLSGPISAAEARESLSSYTRTIPAALWQELRAEGLISEDAPTPDAGAAHEPVKEAS
jgi:D-threo-aldose 1-dehydrogenase